MTSVVGFITLGNLDVGEKIIIKWTLKEYSVRLWAGFGWLRIESSGRSLWTQYLTFGFHKWPVYKYIY